MKQGISWPQENRWKQGDEFDRVIYLSILLDSAKSSI